VISGNVSGGVGGGVWSTTATLTNCTLAGNTAKTDGGAQFQQRGADQQHRQRQLGRQKRRGVAVTIANLVNVTDSGNTASLEGGGVRTTTATFLSVTVADNTARDRGPLSAIPEYKAANRQAWQ
jgi:hypothetical protein